MKNILSEEEQTKERILHTLVKMQKIINEMSDEAEELNDSLEILAQEIGMLVK